MKKLTILLLGFALIGCSAQELEEENLCKCEKETYEFEQGTTIGVNGLPVMTFEKVILSIEEVSCQDEQSEADAGNGVYFNIKCE